MCWVVSVSLPTDCYHVTNRRAPIHCLKSWALLLEIIYWCCMWWWHDSRLAPEKRCTPIHTLHVPNHWFYWTECAQILRMARKWTFEFWKINCICFIGILRESWGSIMLPTLSLSSHSITVHECAHTKQLGALISSSNRKDMDKCTPFSDVWQWILYFEWRDGSYQILPKNPFCIQWCSFHVT